MTIEDVLKNCDDLLSPAEKARHMIEGRTNVYDGHCYIMAEAYYYLLGGKRGRLNSYVISKKYIGKTTHWFLKKGNGKIIDPTAKQFEDEVIPYDKAKACGFLTSGPSKRAYELMCRIEKAGIRLKSVNGEAIEEYGH